MSARGYTGETDRRRESVNHKWYPAMMLVSAGDHCGHREDTGGVSGRKAAALEGGLSATEKSMVKRTARWNVNRALSTRDRLDSKVHDCAVGISLAAQYRSTH